ncbi:MAG: hypothetical protein AB1609_17810 [Bacillota bacterium]
MKYDVRVVVTEDDFREKVAGLVGCLAFPALCRPGGGGTVEILVDSVPGGEVSGLEKALVKRGVAFDRYIASDPPMVRRFRPERDGSEEVDVEVELVGGAEPAVPVSQLLEALRECPDYGSLRRRIERLVREAGPVPLGE